jgi:hypothetical protein
MGRFGRIEKVLDIDNQWLMGEDMGHVAVRRAR